MSKEANTIADLIFDPRNPRKRTQRSAGMLAASLQTVGAARSIVIDENNQILCGNGTVEAAAEVGIENVKVVEADGNTIIAVRRIGLSEEDKIKLALFDNRTADLAEWDAEILEELSHEVDLSGLFSGDELQGIIDGWEEGGSDEWTSEEKDAITSPESIDLRFNEGDLIALGRHRLIIGDCTSHDVITKLMNGQKASLCLTDPPYNVDYDPEERHSTFSDERKKNPLGKIKNDVMSDEEFRTFLDKVYANINDSLHEGCPIYIFHADLMGHHFRNAFIAQPWKLQSCLIWKKTVLVLGRSDYHSMHEPILYGWKSGDSHRYYGDRTQTSIIEYATPHYDKEGCDTDGYIHPTQKPTGLLEIFIKNSSKNGDIVIDFFGGSGSTLIACEATDRVCYTSELDPRFGNAIVSRWENLTGGAAKLVEKEIYQPEIGF